MGVITLYYSNVIFDPLIVSLKPLDQTGEGKEKRASEC